MLYESVSYKSRGWFSIGLQYSRLTTKRQLALMAVTTEITIGTMAFRLLGLVKFYRYY